MSKFSAFNPKLRKANTNEDKDDDKIDLFGDNPNWEPGWVKAYRINALGQVWKNHFISKIKSLEPFVQILNLMIFFCFNLVFWAVALLHTNIE